MATRQKAGRTTPTPPKSTAVAAAHATSTSMLRAGQKIRVRATRLGYYDHVRRREGDVFTYTLTERELARKGGGLPTWVERVDPRTPERITTGVEELRKKHDDIIRERNPRQGTPLVNDEGDNPLGA